MEFEIIDILTIMLVPLLFGIMETDSFQGTFCNIDVVNATGILQCDELKDTLNIVPGSEMSITTNSTTDTITFNALATRIITVLTSTWSPSDTDVEAAQIYFVSDGSIWFNVTNSFP